MMVLVAESWFLSVFGWVWFTIQETWVPSPLSAFVFYGFLVLSTSHLIIAALFPEARAPRLAYFNMVLCITLFCGGCIADTFQTPTFGVVPTQPKPDNQTAICCVNCNLARYHRALFFSGSQVSIAISGILIGYLLVQLFLAGGQLLGDGSSRTVWGGGTWSLALAILLACRFIVLFDMSGSVIVDKMARLRVTVIPDLVFYLLIFSQPLLSLATLYWLAMLFFLILLFLEGIPTINLVGIRVIRSIEFVALLVFSVFSSVELWEGGMLTLPLAVTMCVMVMGSFLGTLEAYLGVTAGAARGGVGAHVSAPAIAAQSRQTPSWVGGGGGAPRLYRDVIPVPIQMQRGGKKGV